MFFLVGNLQSKRISLTFALFFMVLDLRLVKIGCRETINFFIPTRFFLFFHRAFLSLEIS